MLKRINPSLLFVGSFILLTLAGMATLMLGPVDKGFTQPFTRLLVVICATVMNLFGGHVRADGVILSFAQGPGAVMVSSGCNAVEVSILYAAAVLAFPAPLKARLIGAPLGVLGLQAINLIRIMTLLVLARVWPSAFDFFHLYVWDAFIMLDGVMTFLAWRHWQSRRWPDVPSATGAVA